MAHRVSVLFGEAFTRHDIGQHIESSARLRAVLAELPAGIPVHPPVPADRSDLERVHDPRHIRMIEELSAYGGRRYIDMDTYVTGDSFPVALLAAGTSIAAARLTLEGESSFALVRPPGHHAEPDRAMGFCLFNNAAIAAAWALEKVDRVAIVDWDLHHGNGTQKIFYRSDRVLFCSVHQSNIFPWTGWIDEIGEGRGKGFTLNAPLQAGAGIGDYRCVFTEIFGEALRHFRPGLVIVSAGQDPLGDDPKGGMRLRPRDFGELASILLESATRPLALVLEGGYGPSAGSAVAHVLEVLRGGEEPGRAEAPVRPATRRVVRLLKR